MTDDERGEKFMRFVSGAIVAIIVALLLLALASCGGCIHADTNDCPSVFDTPLA